MRFVIRADGGPEIGGGHIMRCLTLAEEATRRGHEITFVVGEGPMIERVRMAGYSVVPLSAMLHTPERFPPHAHWLSAPWDVDAAVTSDVIAQTRADWLILDHYGLDARWVEKQRSAKADLKVLALDDLDDRALGSDLVLDPARLDSAGRNYPVLIALNGPEFALLRPEFAALRPASLAKRGQKGVLRRVLIAPGLMDATGLAPMALLAIADMGLDAEVVMGAASQSLAEVQSLVELNDNWTLTLDAKDMAQRMLEADLCIGAAGGTSWERCCMGLPSVVIAVAENQEAGIVALETAGAAVTVIRTGLDPVALAKLVMKTMETAKVLSNRAASLCDGEGAKRVMDYVENSS
jgi:UDP-2,4-diacetamido-2,4,6-trideoxy-beta-L-altropyranose hydrolase